MLVFISDIHLTDGTSGETIKSGAFNKFALYLEDMVDTAKAKEIEIVLLGDIFDIIRSDYWLNSNIRPWSNSDQKDGSGKGIKDYTTEIVKRICDNPENAKSVEYLKKFKEAMNKKGREVKFTYVVGNHDWLINRYPETRKQIAEFIGMSGNQYQNTAFITEGFWDKYGVFARHGDIYDPFNFDGNRDASSLGDAIVIDLINRFPKAVENDIGAATDPVLVSLLKEIDNVRPLIDIPIWIQGVCRKAKNVEIGERVKKAWNDMVDDFLNMDFVKKHDKPWQIDVVDAMQLGLKISKYLSLSEISDLPLRKFQIDREDYKNKAYQEDYMRRNEAEFVLYGHTHGYEIQPLDQVPLSSSNEIFQKTYFNTGTWRKIHMRTAYDVESREFLSWHVMTFIAFYLESEREDKKFEVWNGALG